MRPLKCGLIGCGEIGKDLARLLVRSPIFSEIAVIDSERAEIEVGKIAEGFHFLPSVNIYAGDYCDLADAHVTVITEAIGFENVIRRLHRAATNSTLLIATEPYDKLVTLSWQAFGRSPERLLGVGTFADSSRLEFLISNHLGVSRRDVRAPILGGRGKFAVCPWEYASVGGIPLLRYFDLCGDGYDKNMPLEFLSEICARKDHSPFHSALAAYKLLSALFSNGERIITASVPLLGAYGIEGVAMSLPCAVGFGGVRRTLEIPLCREDEEKLCRYATKLLG